MKAAELRRDAFEIFCTSLKAVYPVGAVEEYVSLEGDVLRVGDRRYNLAEYAPSYVVGCGKAAAFVRTIA